MHGEKKNVFTIYGGFLSEIYTCDWWFLVLGAFQVLLHKFGCHTDDVLTFPVFHHIERLQRADDVTLCDACHLAAGTKHQNQSRQGQQYEIKT